MARRHPHSDAQTLWYAAGHPTAVTSISTTRWYSLSENHFVLALNFKKLAPFMDKLNELNNGKATRQKMANILASDTRSKEAATV